jgi:hypothetical protein
MVSCLIFLMNHWCVFFRTLVFREMICDNTEYKELTVIHIQTNFPPNQINFNPLFISFKCQCFCFSRKSRLEALIYCLSSKRHSLSIRVDRMTARRIVIYNSQSPSCGFFFFRRQFAGITGPVNLGGGPAILQRSQLHPNPGHQGRLPHPPLDRTLPSTLRLDTRVG